MTFPQGVPPAGPPYSERPLSGFSAASLLLGMPGMFAACCVPLVLFTLLAIVCGHIGLSETKHGAERGRALAQGGLLMGYVGLAIGLIVVIGTTLQR